MSTSGERYQLALPAEVAGAVRRLAADSGTGVPAILLAAFAALLCWYKGTERAVIDGRRFDLSGDVSFASLVRQASGEPDRTQPPADAAFGDSPRRWSGLDLELWLTDSAGSITGEVIRRRDADRIPPAEQACEQLVTLLAAVTAGPAAPVRTHTLLSPAELAGIHARSGGAAADVTRSVPALVESRAGASPGAPAVVCGGQRLSYRELDQRASTLASALRAHGVGPGQLVAVCLPRGTAQVEVLLAILKSGGGYLPLLPGDPPARLRALLAEARPVMLVTTAELRAELTGPPAVLCLEDLPGVAAGQPRHWPAPALGPGHLAYVTYTSGSTGRPKGVMITHRGVASLADPRQPMAPRPGDVVAFHTPLPFDAATYELWCTLASGACLLVAPPGRLTLADYRALAREASVLCLTSSLFHFLVDEGCPELASVRLLNVGGETVDPGHVDRAPEQPEILNCYGPTESTMLSTAGPARRRTAAGRVPIGRPLAGRRAYVLDRYLRLVPPGVTGELYLGGDGLGRGYLGQPARTAERFVPDPFAGRRGGRLYRSGDLARWLPGGELEFLGRVDDQVKLRGYRIEPAEVEAALLAHPAVRAAAVAVRETGAGRRLVGYLVLTSDSQLSGIREWLAERLPGYLVPGDMVALAALPLTPWGKLDRQALPPPDGLMRDSAEADGQGGPGADAAAGSATELLVSGVWAAVFGLDRVGLDDNLLDLGGDSLRAMQIVAQLAGLGHHVTLAELFGLGTVRELAAHLDMVSAPGRS